MIWKKHPQYEYEASDTGQIRHCKTKRIRKMRMDRYGYFRFNIYTDGAFLTLTAHRFVAECFYGCADLVVNHIDAIKTNNSPANLEYCTVMENTAHAVSMGLISANCIPVKVNGKEYYSKREAERKTGVNRKSL